MWPTNQTDPSDTRTVGGFTLVEILVVVVLIAIAAAVVVPLTASAADVQARAAADRLCADLRYARSLAQTQGQRYRVVFDTANESYELRDTAGVALPHPVNPGTYTVAFAGTALGSVDLVSANFAGMSTLTFDPLGVPYGYTGVTDLRLSAATGSGQVAFSAGDTTSTVRVEPETGRVTAN